MKAIKSPFTYLKEENAGIKNSLKTKTVIDPKTGEEREIADGPTEKELLDGLMENYRTSLTDSFPFYETAKKSNQIFNEREVQLDEYFKTMHERPQLKNTNSNANEAPLPPVINQNKQATEFVQQVKAKQNAARQFLTPGPPGPPGPPLAPEAPLEAPPVAPLEAPAAPVINQNKQAKEFVQQVKANQKAATQFLAPPAAPPAALEAPPAAAPPVAPPAAPVEGAKEVPS